MFPCHVSTINAFIYTYIFISKYNFFLQNKLFKKRAELHLQPFQIPPFPHFSSLFVTDLKIVFSTDICITYIP